MLLYCLLIRRDRRFQVRPSSLIVRSIDLNKGCWLQDIGLTNFELFDGQVSEYFLSIRGLGGVMGR